MSWYESTEQHLLNDFSLRLNNASKWFTVNVNAHLGSSLPFIITLAMVNNTFAFLPVFTNEVSTFSFSAVTFELYVTALSLILFIVLILYLG